MINRWMKFDLVPELPPNRCSGSFNNYFDKWFLARRAFRTEPWLYFCPIRLQSGMPSRRNPRGCIVVQRLTSGRKGPKCQAFVRGYFQPPDSSGIAQIPESRPHSPPLPAFIGLTAAAAFKQSRNPSCSNPWRPNKTREKHQATPVSKVLIDWVLPTPPDSSIWVFWVLFCPKRS